MARPLAQIMAELDPYYSGSKTTLQSQMDAAPAQQEAELSGIDARLTQANDNILADARRRGIGHAGIPMGEQAKYAATDYAPAVANLKGKYVTQKNTLLEALNQLGRDQMTQAQGMFDSESNRELQQRQLAEQQRQFNERLAFEKAQADAQRRAAAASSGGLDLSGLLGGGGAPKPKAAAAAKTYVGNDDYRGHLAYLAGKGNYEAKTLLNYVGNDNVFNGKVKSKDDYDILKRNNVKGNYSYGTSGNSSSPLDSQSGIFGLNWRSLL